MKFSKNWKIKEHFFDVILENDQPTRYLKYKLMYFAFSKVLNRPKSGPQSNLEWFLILIKSPSHIIKTHIFTKNDLR